MLLKIETKQQSWAKSGETAFYIPANACAGYVPCINFVHQCHTMCRKATRTIKSSRE